MERVKERNNSLPLTKGPKLDSSKSSMRSADSHSTKKIVRNHRCKRSFSSPAAPAPPTRSARQKSAAVFDMEALNRTAAEIKNHLDNNNRKSRPRHRELPKIPEKKPHVEPLKKIAEPAKTPSKNGTEPEKIRAEQPKANQVKSAANKDPAKVTPVKIRRHSETVTKKVETENHGSRPRSATKTISDYKTRRKSEFKPAYIDKRHGHSSSMGNALDNKLFSPSTKITAHKGSVEKKRSKSQASKQRRSNVSNNNNNNYWIKNHDDSCKLNHFALDRAKAKKIANVKEIAKKKPCKSGCNCFTNACRSRSISLTRLVS